MYTCHPDINVVIPMPIGIYKAVASPKRTHPPSLPKIRDKLFSHEVMAVPFKIEGAAFYLTKTLKLRFLTKRKVKKISVNII